MGSLEPAPAWRGQCRQLHGASAGASARAVRMKAPSVSYSFEPLNTSYLPLLRLLLQEIFQLVPLKETFFLTVTMDSMGLRSHVESSLCFVRCP